MDNLISDKILPTMNQVLMTPKYRLKIISKGKNQIMHHHDDIVCKFLL